MLVIKGMRFPLDVIIVFCMPAQRRAGLDQALLSARTQGYEKARQANPLRCSRQIRNWSDVNTPQNKELHTILKVA